MASRCPRCGNVAAADGHALYGETQDCIEAFALAQRLAKWATEWTDGAPSSVGQAAES